MMHKKECVAFLAGVAVTKAVTFAVLGANNVLPLKVWFFTLTPELNSALFLFWTIAAVFFIYYTWFKK